MDKDIKKAILEARKLVCDAEALDSNEAETRRRIETMFTSIMGYRQFENLTREHAVRGAGEQEYADFAIQLESGPTAKPEILVEIKRVSAQLAPKHLNQVSTYAINAGCEWMILTNSKDWRLYRVKFGQPPVTKLIRSWSVVADDIQLVADCFELISLKSLKKRMLEMLWLKENALESANLLQAILSEAALNTIRRELRKNSDISLTPEEVVTGIRRLLNEHSLSELENVRISLRERKRTKKKASAPAECPETADAAAPATEPKQRTEPPPTVV